MFEIALKKEQEYYYNKVHHYLRVTAEKTKEWEKEKASLEILKMVFEKLKAPLAQTSNGALEIIEHDMRASRENIQLLEQEIRDAELQAKYNNEILQQLNKIE